jgi:hypothetical protein
MHSPGDHLHEVGLNSARKLERVCQPDFESIFHDLDGEGIEQDTVTWSDMSAAFSLLLSWMCGRSNQNRQPPSIEMAGWRAHALLYLLDPTNARYASLEEIGTAGGVTKAAVSKALVDLRQELGGILPFKISGSSDNYRKAQQFAVAAQEHSSFLRKDSKKRKLAEQVSLDAVGD